MPVLRSRRGCDAPAYSKDEAPPMLVDRRQHLEGSEVQKYMGGDNSAPAVTAATAATAVLKSLQQATR